MAGVKFTKVTGTVIKRREREQSITFNYKQSIPGKYNRKT